MPHFDPTISVGTLLTCGTTVVAAIYTVGKLIAKLENVAKKQDALELKMTTHEAEDHHALTNIQEALLDLAMARKSSA